MRNAHLGRSVRVPLPPSGSAEPPTSAALQWIDPVRIMQDGLAAGDPLEDLFSEVREGYTRGSAAAPRPLLDLAASAFSAYGLQLRIRWCSTSGR